MSQAAREKYARKHEGEDLRRAFERLDVDGDKRIGFKDLAETFKKLGHKVKKLDIEDMIWEVDEDCDKAVSWKEFEQMFHRVRSDTTGYEPRRLFNVVEFMMNDKDESGTVSMEEAMNVLYMRNGKDMLDEQVKEIFGEVDIDDDKQLSLTEFLTSLQEQQVREFRSKGPYKPPPPGKNAPKAAAK